MNYSYDWHPLKVAQQHLLVIFIPPLPLPSSLPSSYYRYLTLVITFPYFLFSTSTLLPFSPLPSYFTCLSSSFFQHMFFHLSIIVNSSFTHPLSSFILSYRLLPSFHDWLYLHVTSFCRFFVKPFWYLYFTSIFTVSFFLLLSSLSLSLPFFIFSDYLFFFHYFSFLLLLIINIIISYRR